MTILGDTRKTNSAVRLGWGADLLVHEATYEASESKMARNHGHSTSKQAADVAQEAGVKRLLLTHISARYVGPLVGQLVKEAQLVHENSFVVKDFYEEKKLTRTIAITGATGDIAAALIQALPNDHLILLSRNIESLKEKYGHLTNVELLENRAVHNAQPISVDILINNAGFGLFKELSALTDQEIEDQFEINSIFPIQCIRFFNPKVQLINIASIAGKIPSAKSTIYAASKAALIAFSDAYRMERPDLIVTTVNSGPVKTKFHADNQAYLKKVGSNAITSDKVAAKIISALGKNKREINLPWQMTVIAKLRQLPLLCLIT